MKMTFGSSWTKKLEKRIEGFQFQVGVLDDKPHRMPQPPASPLAPLPTTNYAGGPVLKASRTSDGKTNAEILIENQERLNIDFLRRPFQEKNSEIIKFTTAFLNYACTNKGSIKRVENLLQAVVRNPILRLEYGSNSALTADVKGFDRHLFGTGQMFKSIVAKAKRA